MPHRELSWPSDTHWLFLKTWWRLRIKTFFEGLCEGQWRGALIIFLSCAWTNGWANNRVAGDLKRHRAHYDVAVINSSETQISQNLVRSLSISVTQSFWSDVCSTAVSLPFTVPKSKGVGNYNGSDKRDFTRCGTSGRYCLSGCNGVFPGYTCTFLIDSLNDGPDIKLPTRHWSGLANAAAITLHNVYGMWSRQRPENIPSCTSLFIFDWFIKGSSAVNLMSLIRLVWLLLRTID